MRLSDCTRMKSKKRLNGSHRPYLSMQHPTSLDESFAQIYNEHALKDHFQSIGPPIQPEEMGLSYDDIQIQLDEQTEFPMAVQYVDGLEHSSGFSILRDTTQMTAVSAEVDTVAEEPAMTGVIRIESQEPTPTADVSSLGYPPLTEGLPHELYGQQLHSRDPRPSEPQNVYHDFNVLPTPPSEDTYFRATQRESPSLDGLQTIPDDFAGKIPASLEANPRSSEAPSLDQAAFEDTSMIDVDAAYDVNAQEVVEPAEELGYSVNEAATEFTSDDDADGEVDEEVEVLSATLEIEVDRMDYTVEEPLTEAESRASLVRSYFICSILARNCLQNRDMSIDIASVGTPVPVASGDIPHDAPGDDPLSEVLVESVAEVLLLANEAKENHDMLCPGIPMPVSADPNVPDPTSRAHSPRPLLENSPTAETPGLEHEASRVDTTKDLDRFDNIPIAVAPWQLKALQEGDSKPVYNGLFTPAAGSTSGNITPASVDDLPEQIPVTVPEKPLEENIIEPAQNDVVPEAEPGIPEDDHDSIASSSRSTPVAAPVVREDISTAPEHTEQPDTITEDSASQDTMVVAEVQSTESSVQHLQADRTLEDVSMVDPDIPGLGSFSSRAPSPPTADPEVRSPSPTILPTPTAVSVSPETVPHASESTDRTVRESQALQAELLKSPIKTPPTLTIDVTPHRPTLQPLQPSPQLTARQPKAKPTTTPTVKVRVEPRPAPFTSQEASTISPRRTNRKSLNTIY
ncbi:hypothetical protein BDN72DRAFT_120106 [Pluteus cervinus]|uniref:Uncharacterized protein n=1 Tax=Pluteus cervinus TaxID=181527 RepID=A0ACD3B8J7_9AGAR|nr:hypothetical protein BDN72DRAFT_120106 [Pluteus cervinus]